MITVRRSAERDHARHGWLDSFHSFSFADYHDPAHMGFGPLRVINEDRVQPGQGFGMHGHRDMEIVSYVLEGQLSHRDDMGNGSVIEPGDVQRMSAGRGVKHSEFNPSLDHPVHFLQIWIEPSVTGIAPSYEQKHIGAALRRGRLAPIASPDGRDGSVRLHQDATIYAALLDGAERAEYAIPADRRAYVHVARGSVRINDASLAAGDAVSLVGGAHIAFADGHDAEVLLFDLP